MPLTRSVVDLFCGAGGTSTGILNAARRRRQPVKLTAVNHCPTAINSHSLNLDGPNVHHLCEPVENLWPPSVIPSRHLWLLSASCECTFHSNARGGGPCNEQSRSQPWQIIRWITDLVVENVLMENVPEFQHWGPLHPRTRRPIKSRRGEYFQNFLKAFRDHGYSVEWKIQCCADFGDATTRRRLILLARRNNKPIVWPQPTHSEHGYDPNLRAQGKDSPNGPRGLPRWLSARDHVIDWSLKGASIFNRKKPLAPNTLRRIMAGLAAQGEAAEPFLILMRGTNASQLDGCHYSLDKPLPTVTASGKHHYLVETLPDPFIIHATHHGKRRSHAITEPLPTVTAARRGELQLVQPIIVQTDQTGGHGSYARTVEKPIGAVVSKQNMLLVEPVEPFLTKYYGNGTNIAKITKPIDTITAKDRFLLVEPVKNKKPSGARAKNPPMAAGGPTRDILIRLLQPHELARAHSFPKGYKFTGTKEDQTKQIGNSVPVKLAEAHAYALMD